MSKAHRLGDWLYDNRTWAINQTIDLESIWLRAALAIPAIIATAAWLIIGGLLLLPIMIWLIVEGDHD